VRSGLFTAASALLLAATGCATYLSTAHDYASHGRHELAVYYLAGHYRTQQDDDAKAELVRGVQAALRSIQAAYDTLAGQGRLASALGAATRLEDLLDLVRGLGLGEFGAVDADRLVREVTPRAARQAVRAVDEAEAKGGTPRTQTALLRKALALDPHNPELAARYERLRSGLKVNLAPRPDCDPRNMESCREFIGLATTRLSAERREFTQLVPEASEIRNAELHATVAVAGEDSRWKKVRSGEVEGKVEEKDRFRETRRDADGNKLYRKVYAHYSVFERVARATVTVRVRVLDLRPGRGVVFDTEKRLTETDRRTYLTWSGDERALGNLKRFGTDRTPPQDPERLARTAMRKLADTVARMTLEKLEGTRQ
jgi:hypothetical protein